MKFSDSFVTSERRWWGGTSSSVAEDEMMAGSSSATGSSAVLLPAAADSASDSGTIKLSHSPSLLTVNVLPRGSVACTLLALRSKTYCDSAVAGLKLATPPAMDTLSPLGRAPQMVPLATSSVAPLGVLTVTPPPLDTTVTP